jgi:hypothetical protein
LFERILRKNISVFSNSILETNRENRIKIVINIFYFFINDIINPLLLKMKEDKSILGLSFIRTNIYKFINDIIKTYNLGKNVLDPPLLTQLFIDKRELLLKKLVLLDSTIR